MGRRFVIVLVVGALVMGLAPPAAAAPRPARMEVSGLYGDFFGLDDLFVERDRVRLRTRGLTGTLAIDCRNPVCFALGLDGSTVDATTNLNIVLDFAANRDGLTAVIRGRARTNFIFADGFESGDLARVRGTASCSPMLGGGRDCDVVMNLRGRVGGPDFRGRSLLQLSGRLVLVPDAGAWDPLAVAGGMALRPTG